MAQAPPLFDSLGAAGGMHEAKAILNAFALLLLYEPGDETCARLAVLAGVEAEKAKLPPDLWKPLLRVVSGKEKLPAVHEVVQRMAAGTAAHLAEQDLAAKIKTAPRVILDQALLNMEQLPTYHVSAELSAADGRKSTMQASLAPGAMYLQFTGFDSRKESRLVTAAGYHISTDDGKTWLPDPDAPAAQGLCRTLQAPLDRSAKVTEKHAYQLAGVEQLDGEQLFHFLCEESAPPALPEFWILLSKNGPVVRRARMSMTFGELTASALLIYTRLGKEVDIPELEPIPDK